MPVHDGANTFLLAAKPTMHVWQASSDGVEPQPDCCIQSKQLGLVAAGGDAQLHVCSYCGLSHCDWVAASQRGLYTGG
eukprot:SAG31_NODE_155_length_22130_cov_9.540098_7_plen_78_part_00